MPRKLKKSMKSTLYSMSMNADSTNIFEPYAILISAFGTIELLKDVKRMSTND